jgi:hypothetical protein
MIEFKSSHTEKKDLILFVHGFTGGSETWSNINKSSFPNLLLSDPAISERFDIACFEYYTKLFDLFSTTSNIAAFINRIIRKTSFKLKKNTSIEEIANTLRIDIQYHLQSYDNIIIVAHSMGGLVAKTAITQYLTEGSLSKIQLFISLAVPHNGATLATFGQLVSNNIQIGGLAPFNQFMSGVNDAWLKSNARPITKYFYGTYDTIVPKASAVPADKEKSDIISVEEDHSSICKPTDSNTTVFKAVRDIILNFNPHLNADSLEHQSLTDDSLYEDEIFVLKLLIADIQTPSIKDAKELFLNAEYMRKVFSSESDRKKIEHLYEKVRGIYKDSYNKFIHDGIANSGLLLSDVHEKISQQDKLALECAARSVHAAHKKGMLHQMANQEARDIWWTKEVGMDLINKYIEEKK